MANLSDEEPDALMCARPGLWEPWRVTARATRPCGRKRYNRDELEAPPSWCMPTPAGSGSEGRAERIGTLHGLAERTVGHGPLADFPLVDRAVERAHHPGLDFTP
jgi:hypothetical protein